MPGGREVENRQSAVYQCNAECRVTPDTGIIRTAMVQPPTHGNAKFSELILAETIARKNSRYTAHFNILSRLDLLQATH